MQAILGIVISKLFLIKHLIDKLNYFLQFLQFFTVVRVSFYIQCPHVQPKWHGYMVVQHLPILYSPQVDLII